MVASRNLDMFKAVHAFQIPHTKNKSGEKTYHSNYGSIYGLILTILYVTVLSGYLFYEFRECFKRTNDTLTSQTISNNFDKEYNHYHF